MLRMFNKREGIRFWPTCNHLIMRNCCNCKTCLKNGKEPHLDETIALIRPISRLYWNLPNKLTSQFKDSVSLYLIVARNLILGLKTYKTFHYKSSVKIYTRYNHGCFWRAIVLKQDSKFAARAERTVKAPSISTINSQSRGDDTPADENLIVEAQWLKWTWRYLGLS
jgi:hypothetical protein